MGPETEAAAFATISTEQLEREAAVRLAEVQRRKDYARAVATLDGAAKMEGDTHRIMIEGDDCGDRWSVDIAAIPGVDVEAFARVIRIEAARQRTAAFKGQS